MARYVMANRRAGKFREPDKIASRMTLDAALGNISSLFIVNDNAPTDLTARRVVVFDATPEEVEAKRASMSTDVMLEPQILHWPVVDFPTQVPPVYLKASYRLPPASASAVAAALPRAVPQMTFDLRVTGAGQPLVDAEVELYLVRQGGGNATAKERTDAAGWARLGPLGPGFINAAVVTPAGGFWTMLVRGPVSGTTVDCLPLPRNGPGAWWHEELGIDLADPNRGQRIRIGVIDTGCGPHPALAHVVGVGAYIEGQHIPGGTADVRAHGTHCTGIIGARPAVALAGGAQIGFEGIARGCDLYAARVFPPGGSADQADISLAIAELSRERDCHLINLSLGTTERSEIEHDAILDALQRGTLCVCAAGNVNNDSVLYPAAFREAVAVAALGRQGWGPPGTLTAARLPVADDRFGERGLYLANFSCFGERLACAAPGVGILSSFPDRNGQTNLYGAMDGTSQASPAACAALAVMLSRLPDYLELPRDSGRAQAARAVLAARCRDTGLAPSLQGHGIPYTSAIA